MSDHTDEFVPFPVDCLPSPLCEFVTAGAKAIGCDPSYIALPVLAVCGAAIGNSARVRVKDGYMALPVIWTAIIGDSGTSKTPALKLALKPVRDRQDDLLAAHVGEMRDYKRKLAIYKKAFRQWEKDEGTGNPPGEPVEPFPAQCVVSDTTIEALTPLLARSVKGQLLACDELAVWIGSLDKYKNGSGDAPQFLQMHSGETLIVNRVKSGLQSVPNASLSITGGIQPGILKRSMGDCHRDSGMLARFLMCCPPRILQAWNSTGIAPSQEERYAQIVNRLFDLPVIYGDGGKLQPLVVGVGQEVNAAYAKFYDQSAREMLSMSGDLAAAWSKLRDYVWRLCLVIHLVRDASDDESLANQGELDMQTMSAAIRLVEWFKHETKRVYAMLSPAGVSGGGLTDEEVLEIVRRKFGSLTAKQLRESSRKAQGKGVAEALLQRQVDAGHGVMEPTGKGDSLRFVLMT